jgi:hypothetical protein
VDLPNPVYLQASGMPPVIKTVEQAIQLIDSRLPVELRRLPRWSFAHALLVEALRTKKSRDLRTAARQFRQALSNEKWLVADRTPERP